MTEAAGELIAGLVGRAADCETELRGTPAALQRFAAWLRTSGSDAAAVELDIDDDGANAYPEELRIVERRFTDARQLRIGLRGPVLIVEGGSDAAEYLAAAAEIVAAEAIEMGNDLINRHQHIESLGDDADDWCPVALDSVALVVVSAWPGVAVGSAC